MTAAARSTPSKPAAAAAAIAATVIAASTAVADPAVVRAWLDEATKQYRGKGAAQALRALVLASICPRPINVLLLGPPGVGKTSMCAAVARAFAQLFLPVTLSPFTERAELEGPPDIRALADGRLERVVSATRPSVRNAHMILLDELPRSVSGTRALCLSILSDRVTPTWDPCPAHVIVAGANTRLTSEDDRALVDRFALRVEVPYLDNADDVRHVLTREVPVNGKAPSAASLAGLDPALLVALRERAARVDVPADVADALTRLALAMRQPSASGTAYPAVSDRRWVLISRVLQASATLAGRDSVDWSDLTDTLPMCLDDGPESRAAIRTAINAALPRWVAAFADLRATCAAAVTRAYEVGAKPSVATPEQTKAHANVVDELEASAALLSTYGRDVATRADDLVTATLDEVRAAFIRGQAEHDAARRASKAAR